MSEQTNQTDPLTMSPQELRQRMLDELEASRQVVEELSDEELEEVAGGASAVRISSDVFHDARNRFPNLGDKIAHSAKTFWNSQVSKSGGAVLSASGVGAIINNS